MSKRPNSKCHECPYESHDTYVPSKYGTTNAIAFVGEAPGAEEVTKREPFVGPSGRQLYRGLYEAGIFPGSINKLNACGCRMPDNDSATAEARIAVECCKPGLLGELEKLAPKIVVALGATAAEVFGIDGSVRNNRGSLVAYECYHVLPTYHPAMVIREARDGRVVGFSTFVQDLKKAAECAETGATVEENFELDPTEERIKEFIDDAVDNEKLIAVDIETTRINRAFGRVVVVGLADTSSHGISVWFEDGGCSPSVRKGLQRLFSFGLLVFQNALFDVPFLEQAAGFTFGAGVIKHDTMLLHHCISPELFHDIGYIVSAYGKTPYWKDIFKKRKESILNMDRKELLTYNLRDCVVLHQVLPGMLADLAEYKLEKIYYDEAIPMILPVKTMMLNGMVLSIKEAALWKTAVEVRYEKAKLDVGELIGSQEVNFNSDFEVRWLLYGKIPSTFYELDKLKSYAPIHQVEIKCPTCKKKTWVEDPLVCPKCGQTSMIPMGVAMRDKVKNTDTDVYRKLVRLDRVSKLETFADVTIAYKGRKTDGGELTINEQGRLGLRIHLQNELENKVRVNKPKIERCLRFLELYETCSEVEHMLSTYTKYKPDADGKIHTAFKIHGTVTRRLSSAEPNLQNLPKADEDDENEKWKLGVRKLFTASEGHSFVSLDYSNLEFAVLTYASLEPEFLKVIEQGLNIHDVNTKILFGIDVGDVKWKPCRAAAKIFMFGGVQYGGNPREIYEKIVLKVPKLGLTFKHFKEARNRYFDTCKTLALYQADLQKQAQQYRRVFDPFGRHRLLYGLPRDIMKEALNFPIQAGASYIINKAMIDMMETKFGKNLVLQIHDQLIFDVPTSEVPECASVAKRVMETPRVIRGIERVFPVDTEIGFSWGTLSKYKEAT